MSTRNIAAVLLVLSVFASNAKAIILSYSIDLVSANVPTFTASLTAGPNVDVYHVTVSNPNAGDATSLSLSFTGSNFVNNNPGGLTFSQTGTALPAIATFTFGETFFVLPPGQILSVNDVDTSSELTSEYTLAGSTALIPAGGSTVVAVLSIPTGELLEYQGTIGHAAINGELECITILCPEPSAALLCGLALACSAMRRH